MSPAAVLRVVSKLAELGADLVDGADPITSSVRAAEILAGAACDLGCAKELSEHLSKEAVDRVDAEVEEAIRKKVHP